MNTHKIPALWQKMLTLRPAFSGTNKEFCHHHQVSVSAFYKYKNMQQKLTSSSVTRFVHVQQAIHEQTTHQAIHFNVNNGQVSLPASLSTDVIIGIIKGLSS